jgi:hypothetical protein
MQQKIDVAAEALKATPPVTVASATLAGVSLNDVVLLATLIYIVLQASFLLYRWWRMHTGQGGDGD